jgi:uncharacterized protein (DUF2141 family)
MKILIFLFILCVHSQAYSQMESVSGRTVPSVQALPSDHAKTDGKSEETYSITVTVTNIRNKNGVIRFKFYDDTTPFPDLQGFLKVVVPKTEVTGDSLTMSFHGFKAQNMAIALLDDENNNVKLDLGWFLPKEGHAFSDYYHAALRRPVYEDFKFFLNGDRKVVMKMKYY